MIFAYFIPILWLFVLFYAKKRGVLLYDSFINGAKKAYPLTVGLLPYLTAVLILSRLFTVSGLDTVFSRLLSPVCAIFGIPTELCKLLLIKPFSGSGSTALLSEIFITHGADSYVARCASVVYGSTETTFYISAVYFSKVKLQKIAIPIAISLVSGFFSSVFGCFLCRFL